MLPLQISNLRLSNIYRSLQELTVNSLLYKHYLGGGKTASSREPQNNMKKVSIYKYRCWYMGRRRVGTCALWSPGSLHMLYLRPETHSHDSPASVQLANTYSSFRHQHKCHFPRHLLYLHSPRPREVTYRLNKENYHLKILDFELRPYPLRWR